MRTSALIGAKNYGFCKWCIRTDKGGEVELARIFFAILYGRLMWTAPYLLFAKIPFVVLLQYIL